MNGLSYGGVGVDYGILDAFKRTAQEEAAKTGSNMRDIGAGFKVFEPSRGESAFLVETPEFFLAHVEEGLGTKNLVADDFGRLTGESYYDRVAQCAVAMIVNDLVTLGALPISVAMHLAVGDSSWFADEKRCRSLTSGWRHACDLARCVWGGGETPALRDIVLPGTALLSGSSVGIVKPKDRLLSSDRISSGDAIVFIGSSGIHANGLTLARKIAEMVPNGYLQPLDDGRAYGEALLDPTVIYVGLIADCLGAGLKLHYAVNVTGHGWRKLMRAPGTFAYVIDRLPPNLPIFRFLQYWGQLSDREAYGNLNMGVGFALYVSPDAVADVVRIAGELGLFAMLAGQVEASREKRVVIRPIGLEFGADTLAVR